MACRRKRPRLSANEEADGSADFDRFYFRAYGDISIHETMLGDTARTNSYRSAIFGSGAIKDKVILDVGAGTGILSVFCAQAGAKHVYAVEASSMAEQAKLVIKCNGVEDRVSVIQGKVEDIELPEMVDVIVSEWMGYLLVYEWMLSSIIFAREKWLKNNGVLFPNTASVFIAPLGDCEDLRDRLKFWEEMRPLYGVEMASLQAYARKCLTDVVHVQLVPPQNVQAHACQVCHINLKTVQEEDLSSVKGNFQFKCFGYSRVCGFVVWFDVTFPDHSQLSTSPYAEPTHWEQCIVYTKETQDVAQDTEITGTLELKPHRKVSRYVEVDLTYKFGNSEETHKQSYSMDEGAGS
ncbi:protein arginine N-methyltransferase 6-like [Lingula anatina]|uniref:Protein arginine N-methyltransferase 6 n=1 Tax=Lingula anatina TaxID=7574 RepID=A0A1S3K4Z5_LINAN|nr:protein arginine N-methyltransferase 6-like [Lingula anatina]|eukprot:XP_013417331.1 protein arginine N-methyltransferase 6-like [Lingula anatina]